MGCPLVGCGSRFAAQAVRMRVTVVDHLPTPRSIPETEKRLRNEQIASLVPGFRRTAILDWPEWG